MPNEKDHGSYQATDFQVPNYESHSNRFIDPNGYGVSSQTYPFQQRYSIYNIDQRNGSNYGDDISLGNVLTTSTVQQKVEIKPATETKEEGGLYFNHGYNAYTKNDKVTATGFNNVDIDKIAVALIEHPSFELHLHANADSSGDTAANQLLSENRMNTAKDLLFDALKAHGLTADQAQSLWDARVAPHMKDISTGESQLPKQTGDNVKDQANRVVLFDLIMKNGPQKDITTTVIKNDDFDNHDHAVILNIGTSNKQKEINFMPEERNNVQPGQLVVADENIPFVLRIDPDRKSPITVNYFAHSNHVADNTNFLIETDKPGSVSSTYNAKTGMIDVNQNGHVVANIYILPNIDPAIIRVGQITPKGAAVITPLTNLADVAPLSESRHDEVESSPVWEAGDKFCQVSLAAKDIYMKHQNDFPGYLKALNEYGLNDKVNDAFKDLDKADIDTKFFKDDFIKKFTDKDYMSNRDNQNQLVVHPLQTFYALHEHEVQRGALPDTIGADPYRELAGEVTRNGQNAQNNNTNQMQQAPIVSKGLKAAMP